LENEFLLVSIYLWLRHFEAGHLCCGFSCQSATADGR
jgi:hypothetical protein